MQWTAIFLLGCCLSVAAAVKSQSVTFSGTNVPIREVMQSVKQQTGYVFIYNDSKIKLNSRVSVRAEQMPLTDFLTLIFINEKVDFKIEESTVILKPRIDKPLLKLLIENPPITVKGRVLNEKGEPVAVTIMIKGKETGAVTDSHGNFTLEYVEPNATLIISGISIETQEIKLESRTELTISVVTKITSQEEIVVSTGYFSSTKRNALTNIARVDAKDIEKQPVTSPLIALQGRMAGVDVSPVRNSGPGGAIRIQIRGQNSLRTGGQAGDGNLPLYVVDGVPVDARPLQSNSSSIYQNGYDPLSAINPANIENIQVLKDAAATAIYGSRGANGVVLITTKKGGKSDNTNLDVSLYAGVGDVAQHAELLNAKQYLEMRHEAFNNDGVQPGELDYDLNGDWDTTSSTDWQKELLGGTAKVYDGQINFTGGNQLTNFRFGGGYHKENSFINNDFGFTRVNMNLAVNHTSANRRFKAYSSINYGSTKSDLFDDANFVASALRLPPVAPALYDSQGNLNWQIDSVNGALRNTWENPLSFLKKTSASTIDNIIGSATLSYEIISGLNIKTNIGFSQTNGDENVRVPISSYSPTSIDPNLKGISYFGTNNRKSWIVEPQLTYDKSFHKHRLEMVVGGSYQVSEFKRELIQGTGYSSDALLNSLQAASALIVNSDNAEYKYIAGFGNIKYEYDGRYLLSISGRRDGSSRFGPGKQYGNFGAIGAGWIFSNEKFLRSSSLLTFGKIRGSYGSTGNDQIQDYRFYNFYAISPFRYQDALSLYPTGLYNSDFAWETTQKLEFGLELGLFNNVLSAEISWYRNKSSNQLVDYLTPSTTGFTGIFKNFDATVENMGWEFVLNSTNIARSAFKWTTSFNLTLPKNKLASFPGIAISPYALQFKVGEPLSIQNLYAFEGVDPANGKLTFADTDGNGTVNSLDKILTKPLIRIFYGGLGNTLSYGNVDLSFLFQFSNYWSADFYAIKPPGSLLNQSIEVLERWQKPGQPTQYAKFSQTPENSDLFTNFLKLSDANTRKIYFVRLKTLSLGYRIPSRLSGSIHMQDLRVFLQGQNLWTLTDDKTRLDPETGFGLPPLRIINLGVQIKF